MQRHVAPGNVVASFNESKSDFLNNIRWIAAILVLVGHTEMYAKLLMSPADIKSNIFYYYLTQHAHIAVIIFFVLSGYLVGYATYRKISLGTPVEEDYVKKDTMVQYRYNFNDYFLDRWSRIYSVLIVSLLFTIFLDKIGYFLSNNYVNPEYIPQEYTWFRLFINLFSFQGIQGHRVQFGSNPALWSIGYEFCYYIIFGLIIFRKQLFKKQYLFYVTISMIFLTLGFKMFGYFLIWVVGYTAFLIFHKLDFKLSSRYLLPLFIVLVFENHFLVYKNIAGIPQYCQDVLIAVNLSLILLCNGRDKKPNTYLKYINSYFADYSYSIYAYHLPVIFFYYSIIPKSFESLPFVYHSMILIILCLIIARILYYISEHQRIRFRNAMKTILKTIRVIVA